MKKRILATAMTVVMAAAACINFTVPGFARATISSNADYNYRNTTGLEYDYADGALILTWPSVAKDGTLLNQNPLTSYAMSDTVEDSADPMASWTMPYRGLIVNYNGYTTDYSASKTSISLTGEEEVYMGFVEGAAEGYQTILDYAYDSSAAAYLTGGVSHIDTTVVTTGYATSYRIDYSTDGENWTAADTTSTFNTQKKVDMPTDADATATAKTDKNGNSYIQDNKNTVFLVTQQVENFPDSVEFEEGETYYVRVVPLDGSGNEITITDEQAGDFSISFTAENSNTIKVPAFPTVEGGGIYTTGGRSTLTTEGEGYVVTRLDDSDSNPAEGTIRYGLNHRTSEDVPLTIVFAVGGTIHIDPSATKSQRRFVFGSNTTVAGQTAPGEGITIAGGTCNVSGENIIIRYTRFRLGEGYDLDGATVSGKNIVIDHCSFGWGVDETFSAKELINSSISYNIISSGLAMVNKNGDLTTDAELLSGESEFKHGMGTIMNGYNTTVTHNVWAHNGTRNPRFEGGFTYNSKSYDNIMEFANNVVYNWGHMSSYGGDRGEAQVNFEGNYYKTGPNTLEKVKDVFFDCDTDSTYGNVKSSYYITGNVMKGNDTLNADNTKGFSDLGTDAYQLDERVELLYDYTPTDAYTAYEDVLNGVGASLVRDAQDERLINQIKNGTGRFVNSEAEAGGYNDTTYAQSVNPTVEIDTDSDGIPDTYESIIGTDPAVADSTTLITDETSPFYGYTYLEVYLNDITDEWGENSPSSTAAYSAVARTESRTVESSDIAITGIYDADGNNIMGTANTDLILGETYTIKTASDSTSSSEVQTVVNSGIFEVMFNDDVVATNNRTGVAATPDITVTPTEAGSYLLMLRYNNGLTGGYNAYTLSDQVNITVLESTENIPDWTAVDIGSVPQAGVVSYDSTDSSVIIEGSGLIGYTSSTSNQKDDAFFFDYIEKTGDFDIYAQVTDWEKIDYYQKAGIMARASLDVKSEFYMNTTTYIKGEQFENYKGVNDTSLLAHNVGPFVRTADGGSVVGFSTGTTTKFLSIAKTRMSEEPNPAYVRLVRSGQTITMYGANSETDGTPDWVELASYETTLPDTCYLGFAIDAVQDSTDIIKYNKSQLTNITIDGVALVDTSSSDDPTPGTNTGMIGDVDQNSVLTANDSAALLTYVLNNENLNENWNVDKTIADTNNDDDVTAADAADILVKVLNSAYQFARTNE
ncbi:MAG: hypothetical protein LUH47_02995 [Clostridiales bacterium]|nr:hypothetical protein [Clostridiales bacterium]